MDHLENLAQSYSQAPWRKQVQFIGLFSLVLVFIAVIAGIYLNVSARAAAIGREIQVMQSDIEELDREIEDMETQLASLNSSELMDKRARDLGFDLIQTDEIMFLVVPGYIERSTAALAPYAEPRLPKVNYLPAEYTESLFTWARRQVAQLSVP
ncbi:MAG: septum formation initiator family protein [Chloroflexota bacterium]